MKKKWNALIVDYSDIPYKWIFMRIKCQIIENFHDI